MKDTVLNFDVPFTDLDGKATGKTIGKIIAPVLARDTKGDPLKMFNWATDLNKGKALELDSSDLNTFKEYITVSESFTNLTKAQCLNLIEDAKSTKKKGDS